MLKSDLWCGYCGTQDFIEIPNPLHLDDFRWSTWRCFHCHATFEDNPGYGYFTSSWGDNSEDASRFCLNSGELLDDTKLPRTPEGIVRHSFSEEDLRRYRKVTQIK